MSTDSVLIGGPQVSGGRVERRKARTNAALIAAARSLFAAQGVEPTTIAEIAGRADVAVGSFYNYFATKDELLKALLEAALSEQLAALKSRQAQTSDAAEVISVAHRHLIALARTDPDMAWLLVRLEVPYRVTRSVLWESASADLDAGVAAGLFDVADRELALVASGGALLAVIHAVLHGEAAADVDSAHAEGVLRSFGLAPDRAAEIARRPLPPARA
ncbi:MAG TPA: helix-turn-helix domain-containing protein [Solirubrobacteraceae bacterium]|nr:helix-turn-helix domain-containing protein [Solirubrobacteraceae bacterium]